jgi:hypothetical protein
LSAVKSHARSTISNCKAVNLVLGPSMSGPGLTIRGHKSDYVYQHVHNVGSACTFMEPRRVRVGGASGTLTAIPVANPSRATRWVLKHHQNAFVALESWQPISNSTGSLGVGQSSCHVGNQNARSKILNVTQVGIPLSGSWLKIPLPTTWSLICAAPSKVSVSIVLH